MKIKLKTTYWKKITGWQPWINDLNTYYLIVALATIIITTNTYLRAFNIPIIIITILQKVTYHQWKKEKEQYNGKK